VWLGFFYALSAVNKKLCKQKRSATINKSEDIDVKKQQIDKL